LFDRQDGRIIPLLTGRLALRLMERRSKTMNRFFDGKYNELLDSMPVRLALMAAGFGVWLLAGVSVLRLGV
jgi:hypothetical protein